MPTIVVFSLLSANVLLLLVAIAGVMRAFESSTVTSSSARSGLISVLVPFRNEVSIISNLIKDLFLQDDPGFEVIFVDDHSDDGSKELVLSLIQSRAGFRCISSPGHGKKAALTAGIHASEGSVIITTDADCRLGTKWVSAYRQAFANEKTCMAFGGVRIHERRTLFTSLQTEEFLSVTAAGIASMGLGRPIFCNGANLGFRKKVFVDLGGYKNHMHLASGDDEFLLKEVFAHFPGSVKFVSNPDIIVTTVAQPSLQAFMHQRVRWAGKWFKTPGWLSKVIAPLTLLIQLSVFAAIILIIAKPESRAVLGFLLGAKALLEFLIIFITGQRLSVKVRFLNFAILQLIYPLYVLSVALLTMRGFTWKSRRYNPSGVIPG